MKKYRTDFSKEELNAALHANDKEAIAIIEDENKWTEFKKKCEAFFKKAENIPVLGGVIDDIICMVALVDSYVKKEYKNIPLATIITIVAALIYVLSPVDLIPDVIPVIGYVDDVAVVLLVLNFGVDKDLNKYRLWHEENRNRALISFEMLLAEEIASIINQFYLAGVIVDDDMKIKLLLAEESYAELPVECIVKEINVPTKALEDYDIVAIDDIVNVVNDALHMDVINWVSDIEKEVYYEPDFEDKWDDYIIQEVEE